MKTTTKEPTCYLQVNPGNWCQESYCTLSRDAGRRAKQLRQAGYQVTVCPMGMQVTPVGSVKMTLVDIRPGVNSDTTNLPPVKVERM
jgi:hypothetical protein